MVVQGTTEGGMTEGAKINNGKVIKEPKEVTHGYNLVNSIKVIIKKSDLNERGKQFYNASFQKKFKSYIRDVYNNMIVNGKEIRLFTEKLKSIKLDRKLLHENIVGTFQTYSIIYNIYEINSGNKGINLIINGVKIDIGDFEIIEWGRKPFKMDGYTFKRLFIEAFVIKDNFDLNDKDSIVSVLEIIKKEIKNIIEEKKESFANPKINISLEYDRNDMNSMMKDIGEYKSSKACEKILDEYLKNNKD